jgi:serine phosphatase RsbU (regulator of sigma subunit)
LPCTATAFGVLRELQRQVIVTSLAALALLAAVVMIWARFRLYCRVVCSSTVAVARGVQRSCRGGRSLPGVGVGAACVPASQVGGDFYDAVPLDSRRSAFLVGDVSGHGIPPRC